MKTAPPPPMRLRLTREQQRQLVQHHDNNSSLTLVELGVWAQRAFALPKPPAQSSISELSKRSRLLPAALCDDAPVAHPSKLLDDELSEWIERCARRHLRLTGALIQLMAERLRDKMVCSGVYRSTCQRLQRLTFSKDWLHNFQKRNELRARRVVGEAGSVSEKAISAGRARLRELTSAFAPNDVYNVDETALYYSRAPSTTISRAPAPGTKQSKQRMTVAVAANADGSDKLPLFFVGTARQPRCFGRQTSEQLGLSYASTSKGWVTRSLFTSWVQQLNERMKSEGRQILLLLDGASAHHISEPLSHVQTCILPPNTTSVLQPMGAGVIAALKAWFRRRQGLHAIDAADSTIEKGSEEDAATEPYKVDVLTAMRWCEDAWESVSQSTIANCWTHANIQPEDIYDLVSSFAKISFE